MMTNGDPEGLIFLSHPHTFSCSPLFLFIYLSIYWLQNKLPEVSEHAKMQFHTMTLLDVLGKIIFSISDILIRCARIEGSTLLIYAS